MESSRIAWKTIPSFLLLSARSTITRRASPSSISSSAPSSLVSKSQQQQRTFRLLQRNSAARRRQLGDEVQSSALAFFRRLRSRRYNSSGSRQQQQRGPNPKPNLNSPEPALSLSERLKKLSREYGYSAVGVYFGLSALDFPFCFLAVRWLGTERIGRWEHAVMEGVKDVLRVPFPGWFADKTPEEELAEETELAKAAAEANNATIWTQLALAYAIHKSLIFFRVPLAAAVTPKVVKTLRRWGWDIGKKKPKTTHTPA